MNSTNIVNVMMDRSAEFWYCNTGMGVYSAMVWRHLAAAVPPQITMSAVGEQEERRTDCLFGERLAAARRQIPSDCHVFFAPNNGIGNYAWAAKKSCLVSVVHDVIPYIMPQAVGKGYKEIFYRQMPRILEKSDCIIAVSRNTKADLVKICGVEPSKISVVHCGVEPCFRPLPQEQTAWFLRTCYGLDFPYILYVGGFAARKNAALLLRAFGRLDKRRYPELRLVLVGKPSPNEERLRQTAAKSGVADRVVWLSDLPRRHLPYLYGGAVLFAYPSLYEGFGLPPLEAMACGTPVLAADNSSLSEVVGGGGRLLNACDEEQWACQMDCLLLSTAEAAQLAKNGILRAKKFSWQKNAEKTVEIFKKFAKSADR